jgi:hypothetical protein
MDDLPALSSMARKALQLLKVGGEFRYGLEMSSYTRREQFKARLKTASGRTVCGIGVSTMYELKDTDSSSPQTARRYPPITAWIHRPAVSTQARSKIVRS